MRHYKSFAVVTLLFILSTQSFGQQRRGKTYREEIKEYGSGISIFGLGFGPRIIFKDHVCDLEFFAKNLDKQIFYYGGIGFGFGWGREKEEVTLSGNQKFLANHFRKKFYSLGVVKRFQIGDAIIIGLGMKGLMISGAYPGLFEKPKKEWYPVPRTGRIGAGFY